MKVWAPGIKLPDECMVRRVLRQHCCTEEQLKLMRNKQQAAAHATLTEAAADERIFALSLIAAPGGFQLTLVHM